MNLENLINKIYHNRLFAWFFPTTVFCLQKNLKDCKTVLDLGCGPSSPLQFCKNIKSSIGVEAFKPYLEESKKKKIHTEYIGKRIEEIDFPEKSFDAVIMIEVLEHLPEDAGYAILEKTEKWARKKVIVSTPNGFLPQDPYDENPFQKHLAGWNAAKMQALGFYCWGLSGVKSIRHPNPQEQVTAHKYNLTASIRLHPKFFWFVIATLSQFFTYYFPKYAFGMFCVHPVKSPTYDRKSVFSGEFNRVKKIR